MASEPLLDEQLLENFRKAHSYRSMHTDEQRDLLAIAEQLQVRVRAEYHDRVTLESSNAALAQQMNDLLTEVERLRAALRSQEELRISVSNGWRERVAEQQSELDYLRNELSEARNEIDRLGSAEGAMYDEMRERAEAAEGALEDAQDENTAMRPIVAAVAEAAVGDEYNGGSWLMFAGYDAETVRTQARAFFAAHPAAGEGE